MPIKRIVYLIILLIIILLPIKINALTADGNWFSSQGSGSMLLNFMPTGGLVQGSITGIILNQEIESSYINGSLNNNDNTLNGVVYLNTTENQLSGYLSGIIKPMSGEGNGNFIISSEGEIIQANWNVMFSPQAYKNELNINENIISQENDNNTAEKSKVVNDSGITTGEIIFYILVAIGVIGLIVYIIRQGKVKTE